MGTQQIREDVLNLIEEKRRIEDEINAMGAILQQNGIGMTEPLTDSEGFPLNSVDVFQVRHARQRIICLQNDHKLIMNQIEGGLEGYYQSVPQQLYNGTHTFDSSSAMDTTQFNQGDNDRKAFARITEVTNGSPAALAGWLNGDGIVQFGTLNSDNYTDITAVARVVQYSEGQTLKVTLKRNHTILDMDIIPKKWTGRGLLGCNIISIPYQ